MAQKLAKGISSAEALRGAMSFLLQKSDRRKDPPPRAAAHRITSILSCMIMVFGDSELA